MLQTKSLRLGRIIPIGFLIIIAVLCINGIFSKITVNGLTSTTQGVIHSNQVQVALKELEGILVDVQLGERGFIITHNDEFLEPYTKARFELSRKFDNTRELLKDQPEQIERLNELEKISQEGIEVLTKNIGRIREGITLTIEELRGGKKALEVIRQKIEVMLQSENKLLVAKQKAAEEAEKISTIFSFGGMVVGGVLGLFIILFVQRRVVKPINEITNIINNSSSEIAATVAQQELIAIQQAGAVNQTTTTMDELAVSSQTSAEQAETVAISAKQVLVLVEGNSNTNSFANNSTSSLREKVEQIAIQIQNLAEQTNQIGSFAKVVSELSNQTNMLALNAAVEAVRAGEHGKGFSVVAAEIRKLADESKKSAERINNLVESIQKFNNATVTVTNEGKKTVADVVSAVNSITVNIQQISLTAKQQAIAANQVVESMNNLNSQAAQTASGITQTKVSTKNLNDAALSLKVVV